MNVERSAHLPPILRDELARARRIAGTAEVPTAWVEGAAGLAQEWADAEARENGWPPQAVVVPGPAALPDVLQAVARARWGDGRSPGAAEAGEHMAAGLAALRRSHGA